MTKCQCLWYALDQWHERGGYLCLARSAHWEIPHVLHSMSPPPNVTHYVPPGLLKRPWHSVFGFEGNVVIGDIGSRGPMSYIGMLVGTLILLVFGGLWVARNLWRWMTRQK